MLIFYVYALYIFNGDEVVVTLFNEVDIEECVL